MTTTTGSAGTRAQRAAGSDRWRRLARRCHCSYAGLIGATVLFCLSLTPSLLPRGVVLQGLVSGVLAATGYGLGVLAAWLVRSLVGRSLPGPTSTAWQWLTGIGGTAVAISLYLGSGWQREIHQLMGLEPPPRSRFPAVLLIAALTTAALVGLARLLRWAARSLASLLGRWIPASTARLVAGFVVAALAVGVLNGIVLDGLLAVVDGAFRTVNSETAPHTRPPDDPLRSGGPGSVVSWASLGNEGRVFVTGGPSTAQLRAFNGVPAREPIRVYAGLDSAPTPRKRAELAVRDLQRTGAFSRRVLCVVTTTGTGWIDKHAVDPLEYLYNGDIAMVGMQYSYLPSWLSFLVDKQRAREAGRALFDQVYAVWSRLPVEQRPKLLVFGESLGSFGAESAFSGIDDVRNRVDGMLLVGPPNRNTMWRDLVAERDSGSPEVLPSYQQGAAVRFAGQAGSDLDRQPATWGAPRVVYLQHASDPIVWWSPRLLVSRPDWLSEPRGPDVVPSMRWLPFVTFWQVTADMAFSTGVPAGHGHNYGAEPVDAWVRILPPDGWTAERTAALTRIIAAG